MENTIEVKTYFDLLQDLGNHFLEKWGTNKKRTDFILEVGFKKIYSLNFKNEIYPEECYGLGFLFDTHPWTFEKDLALLETLKLTFLTITPKFSNTEDSNPVFGIKAFKRLKNLNDESKGFDFSLTVGFVGSGQHFLEWHAKAKDCIMEILNKTHEMMGSGVYSGA